ncbi:MAG: 23S rRNA (adenine(2503)-C(2))-methyltransferase RlmN [Thermodesulfovibrionales bacterium]
MKKVNLKELSRAEMERFASEMGLPAYRARQILHWIYGRRASSVDDITELSKPLRAALGQRAFIANLALADRLRDPDGTEKFLFELEDGNTIESVLIPDEDRLTLCVSTQAGCAMGCRFCLTGKGGLRRNLRAHEIADQAIAASRLSPERITNIVFMGMGEPLRNLEEVSEALWRLTGLMRYSPRRITVSTSGLPREMLELPRTAPPVNLAVSLNATTDAERDMIMPVNRRHPISELLEACRRYPLQRRRRITFEYVLLDGVNDSVADARRLAGLLRGIPSKVNLIPLNEFEGCGFKRPPDDRVLSFQEALVGAGLTALIRKSKGRGILAACGQLQGARGAA